MSQVIDKLLFITDRCHSEPAGYALCSSQDASNNLLCCTWNVKSAQPLVDYGALEKMLNITQRLLIEKESAAPLRWVIYCKTVGDQLNVNICPFNRLRWDGGKDSI